MLNVKEIQTYLPHRYPFLLVDRILELEENTRVVALKNISVNEDLFNGHFPGNPIFPGVLIIEAMAQAAGVLGFKTMDKTPEQGSVYLFVGADKVRFKRQVVPGDQLILTAEVMKVRRGIWKFDCTATVDGELCCSAEIMCADREI